jgi:hypothetical protein
MFGKAGDDLVALISGSLHLLPWSPLTICSSHPASFFLTNGCPVTLAALKRYCCRVAGILPTF